MRLRGANPFASILDALRLPGLLLPLTCLFVFDFANMAYLTLWAFWLRESFAWGAGLIGLTLTAYGVGVAITQGGILRLLIPRLGEYRTLILAVVAGVLAFVGFGLARVEWLVFAARGAPIYLPGAPLLMSALMLAAILPFFLALNPARKSY